MNNLLIYFDRDIESSFFKVYAWLLLIQSRNLKQILIDCGWSHKKNFSCKL